MGPGRRGGRVADGVGARVPEVLVLVGVAAGPVVARGAAQLVGPLPANEQVVAGLAEDLVVLDLAEEAVVARAAADALAAPAPDDAVGARARHDLARAGPLVDEVVPRAAEGLVAAGPRVDAVGAGASADEVLVPPGDDQVVAPAPDDHLRPLLRCLEDVVALAADDGRLAAAAAGGVGLGRPDSPEREQRDHSQRRGAREGRGRLEIGSRHLSRQQTRSPPIVPACPERPGEKRARRLGEGREDGAQLGGHVTAEAHRGVAVVGSRALGHDRDPSSAAIVTDGRPATG